jgi:hypothetical protein
MRALPPAAVRLGARLAATAALLRALLGHPALLRLRVRARRDPGKLLAAAVLLGIALMVMHWAGRPGPAPGTAGAAHAGRAAHAAHAPHAQAAAEPQAGAAEP